MVLSYTHQTNVQSDVMQLIKMILWLLPRRLRSSWALLAIISFGVLAAVTLMAVAAIYSRALAEGGIRHTIAITPKTSLNPMIVVQNRPLGPSDYRRLRSAVEEINESRLGYMTRDTQRLGQARPNLPLVYDLDGRPPPENAPIGQPFFLTDFEEHARIIEGRWPRSAPVLHDRGLDMEVVIGRQTALAMGLDVGSQAYLIPFREIPSERIAFTVVGVAEPIDTREEYWMHSSTVYFTTAVTPDPEVPDGERVTFPMYIPESTFLNGLGARYPTLVGDYTWFLYLDTSVLTASQVEPAKEAIVGLETDLNKRFSRSLVLSRLELTLTEFQTDLTHARVPLYLFISLVVVVILYFLVLVMGLLSRTRSDEASLLRSRGASMLQVGGLMALGEGIIVLLATAVGPFLALAIVHYLLVGTINPVGEGDPISVTVSADMFIMGAIGGLLSLLVLTASGFSLARLGIVEFLRERARPPTVPFLQRYYVDMLVLAVVGLLWWQIEDREGFIRGDLLNRNEIAVDPSLLMGPVLVLLAAAFLLLRVLPLLIRILTWMVSGLAPAWATFALVRVARDPLPHGSLAVILMMVVALGIFGAAFQSTLARSQREQTLYQVGGDLVLSGAAFSNSTQSALADMDGVEGVSPMTRSTVTLIGGFPAGTVAELLAVDPDTLPDTVVGYRDDFAGKDLPELLRPLRSRDLLVSGAPLRQSEDGANGVVLPTNAESIGVWTDVAGFNQVLFRQKLELWMHLSDALGGYYSLYVGDLTPSSAVPPPPLPSSGGGASSPSEPPPPEWVFLESPLDELDQLFFPPEPPLSVVSIFISGDDAYRLPRGSIGLDDITVKTSSNPDEGIVVEGYERAGTWIPIPNAEVEPDSMEITFRAAHSGRFGIKFSWLESSLGVPRGIMMPQGPFPLPAIGGPMFYVGQEVRVRAGRDLVPMVVRDVTNYFPTIDPSMRPFLLVSLDDYRQYIQSTPFALDRFPGELWLSMDDSAGRGEAVSSIGERLPFFASLRDSESRVEVAERYPLAGGGWDGLTILSISAMTVAVVLALGTYAVVSVRTGRMDLSIVKALGLSNRQLTLSLALERVLIAVIAVASGSVLGVWLGQWVLGFLDIDSRGSPLVPPLIVTQQGWLIALLVVELMVAITLGILLASVLGRRLKASDILRVE